MTEQNLHDLIGLDLPDLERLVADWGVDKFRARQIFQWLYQKGARDVADMTNLPKLLRDRLQAGYRILRPTIASHYRSVDGTEKWLFSFGDNQAVETVFIKKISRDGLGDNPAGTLCISSQIGCTLSCSFCHTGTQKLVRNLTAGEILAQILMVKDSLNDWQEGTRKITNVVFMGMGEPLYNTGEVIKAVQIMMAGLQLSKRKITVSTSGIVPDIKKVGDATMVNLAISLHAPRDDLRDILMPINKKYPLRELVAAVKSYPVLYHADQQHQHGDFQGRRVTWQYVMIKGVNDKPSDARDLVALIGDIPSKVNLIPFNPWQGSDFAPSDEQTMDIFSAIVRSAGFAVPTRTPRGRDIAAACGQLRSNSLRLSYRQQQELKRR